MSAKNLDSILLESLGDGFEREKKNRNEPGHVISNNAVCVTSKASDQPAHMRSLIRAFASCMDIL